MDLEKQEQNQERGIVSDLIIGATAAGIVLTFHQLVTYIKKIRIGPPTIPPIIIKPNNRGQLEIEYQESITTPTSPTRLLTIANFKPVKGVETTYSDSLLSKLPFNKYYPVLPEGVRVEISLQKRLSTIGEWTWVSNDNTSQITIQGYGENVEITVNNGQLSEQEEFSNTSAPARKFKRRYEGNLNTYYRLGRISLYRSNQSTPFDNHQSIPQNTLDSGDRYELAFYNKFG